MIENLVHAQRFRNSLLLFLFCLFLCSDGFAQTATEDFDPANDVFGGGISGANWVNNSWVRSGSNGSPSDVTATDPTDADDNIGGSLLQLKDNDAGAYRIIDLSGKSFANLSFDYDYDESMDGGETLKIEIDPEDDGTYLTVLTLTATTNSPNPKANISIVIPVAYLGGSNTRIRFITGSSNSINKNNEEWWIDNISIETGGIVDSDGDGVDDLTDLDDDNDGIPDKEESNNLLVSTGFEDVIQPKLGNNLGVPISPWILTSGQTNIVKVDGGTGYNNLGPRLDANPNTAAGTAQHYFDINGAGDLYQPFTLTSTRDISYSGYFSPRDGGSGSASISIRQGTGNTGTLMDSTGTITISSNGGDTQNSPWTYAESEVTLPAGTYSMVVVMSNPTNFDEGKVEILGLDSDEDGIVNTLDLDSDNDGIYDAVEAGHGQSHTGGVVNGTVGTDGIPDAVQSTANSGLINYIIFDSDSDNSYDGYELDSDNDLCNDIDEAGFTDPNNDGVLGDLPTVVDSNGLVLGTGVVDGYTPPKDSNTNSIYDFQEAGSVPVISAQPVSQTVFTGNNGVFTVVATGPSDLTYQWQSSVNGGSVFNNLTDNTEYTGTTTPVLTLLSADVPKDTNQYRVLVGSASYACDSLTSSPALLTMRVQKVITNRRISYRVKSN